MTRRGRGRRFGRRRPVRCCTCRRRGAGCWSSVTARSTSSGYVAAASMAGWPVLAEPNGNARYGDHALSAHHFLLGVPEFVERHRPEVVVTLGKPGLSRPLLSFLRRAEEHVVVTPSLSRWPDPVRSATQVAQEAEIPVVSGDDAWLKGWRTADLAARRAVDAVLDESGSCPSRGWRVTWCRRCRAGRCCWRRRACRSATWTRRCIRGGASGFWPTGARAASTAWSRRRSARRWRTATGRTRCSVTWRSCTTRTGWSSAREDPRPDLAWS